MHGHRAHPLFTLTEHGEVSRTWETPESAPAAPVNPLVAVGGRATFSPLRYPGGKSWLVPFTRSWLAPLSPNILLEPFFGGGSVSLAALLEDQVERVVAAELDPDVAAMWRTIRHDGDWLAARILDFDCTRDAVLLALAGDEMDSRERGWRCLLWNRVAHGGVMTSRSGLMRNGQAGHGIGSRWYPGTLARRVRAIAELGDRLDVREQDGVTLLREYATRSDAAAFIDPPYTAAATSAGRTLYSHHALSHGDLFRLTHDWEGHVLLTYDECPEVMAMVEEWSFTPQRVAMNSNARTVRHELLIRRS